MEEGLLGGDGEYDIWEIYRGWSLNWSWVVWRQFVLNYVSQCFFSCATGFLLVVSWPNIPVSEPDAPSWPETNKLSEVDAFVLPPLCAIACLFILYMVSALTYICHRRTKTIPIGFTLAAACGMMLAVTSSSWVVYPLLVMATLGLSPPLCHDWAFPDRWNHGPVWAFLLMQISKWGCSLPGVMVGFKVRDLEWQATSGYLVMGSVVALVIALMVHCFMLLSPFEVLRFCPSRTWVNLTETERKEARVVTEQKARAALERFAKLTGRSLPENYKRLKPLPPVGEYDLGFQMDSLVNFLS